MDISYATFVRDTEARQIAVALEERQYLHPHQAVGEALEEVGKSAGFCSRAAEDALDWMRLRAQAKIGRLRHTEILQLARSIARFWRQNTTTAVTQESKR